MSTLNYILSFWPVLLILIILFAGKLALDYFFKDNKQQAALSVYKKKAYLFDTNSEFNLYKMLLELFGEQYFVFPQINYSHLIEINGMEWKEAQKHRSRIDRKSADFVFCDKDKIVPCLVLELDGSSHNLKKKQQRDQFIDELMGQVGLPIVHLTPENLNVEFVRAEINKKLQKGEKQE